MGDSNSARFSLPSYFLSLFSVIFTSVRRLVLRILAVGPVPKHIAIIMDGNRRFADRSGMERSRGHLFGYDKLIKTLENCLELGVKYVSVYAFSIDNFGRPQDEVNSLMSLMEEKLDRLVTRDSLLNDFGVRVQVLGNLSLLPVNVRMAAERAMAATKKHNSVVLNLCVAYTSTEEIVHSIQEVCDHMLTTARETKPRNGALHSKSARLRARNGLNFEVEVPENGILPVENCELDFQLEDSNSNLEIRGKQNADAALLPAYSYSCAERKHDLEVFESRNGCSRYAAMMMRPKELVNGKTKADPHSRLANECGSADGLVIRGEVNEWLGVVDRRMDPCALVESITVKEIERHLYTAGCPPPDILIRTSGETRLSNFMLWQCCSHSRLSFCKVLWPEFSLRHLAWIILDYQRTFPTLQKQQRLQEQLLHDADL